jgi:hypothetical protein
MLYLCNKAEVWSLLHILQLYIVSHGVQEAIDSLRAHHQQGQSAMGTEARGAPHSRVTPAPPPLST